MASQHASPARDGAQTERVFVTGLGLISPAGLGVERTWQASRERGFPQSPLPAPLDRVLPRERCARIAPELESALPLGRSARRFLSEAARHFIVCAHAALKESRLAAREIRRFGIAVGTSNGERTCRDALRPFLGPVAASGSEDAPRRTPCFRLPAPTRALQTQPGLIAGNLAIACGAGGPVLTFINDGLASGIALGEALRAVAGGACPGMLAGGCGEVDDPWLLLARREARPADAPALPWASAAACLIVESRSSLRARGATPLAEFLGYWQGEPASALRAAARACRNLEVVAVLGNAPRRLRESGLWPTTRSDSQLPADCLAASQALYAALAIHALRRRPGREARASRRVALSVDVDDCGGCTVLLIAEPPAPLRPHSRKPT